MIFAHHSENDTVSQIVSVDSRILIALFNLSYLDGKSCYMCAEEVVGILIVNCGLFLFCFVYLYSFVCMDFSMLDILLFNHIA